MATKKKNQSKAKRAPKFLSVRESLTLLNYLGTLWRTVVFMGVYLAFILIYIIQTWLHTGAVSLFSDTTYMVSMLEGLLVFVLAFLVYDGVFIAVTRRYPWHTKADRVVLLGIEILIALCVLLIGALSYPNISADVQIQLASFFERIFDGFFSYTLFWLLALAALLLPIRAFAGISHMAITRRKK